MKTSLTREQSSTVRPWIWNLLFQNSPLFKSHIHTHAHTHTHTHTHTRGVPLAYQNNLRWGVALWYGFHFTLWQHSSTWRVLCFLFFDSRQHLICAPWRSTVITVLHQGTLYTVTFPLSCASSKCFARCRSVVLGQGFLYSLVHFSLYFNTVYQLSTLHAFEF